MYLNNASSICEKCCIINVKMSEKSIPHAATSGNDPPQANAKHEKPLMKVIIPDAETSDNLKKNYS